MSNGHFLSPAGLGSLAGDYNLHHVCASVCHTVFSETTTVTHFYVVTLRRGRTREHLLQNYKA